MIIFWFCSRTASDIFHISISIYLISIVKQNFILSERVQRSQSLELEVEVEPPELIQNLNPREIGDGCFVGDVIKLLIFQSSVKQRVSEWEGRLSYIFRRPQVDLIAGVDFFEGAMQSHPNRTDVFF